MLSDHYFYPECWWDGQTGEPKAEPRARDLWKHFFFIRFLLIGSLGCFCTADTASRALLVGPMPCQPILSHMGDSFAGFYSTSRNFFCFSRGRERERGIRLNAEWSVVRTIFKGLTDTPGILRPWSVFNSHSSFLNKRPNRPRQIGDLSFIIDTPEYYMKQISVLSPKALNCHISTCTIQCCSLHYKIIIHDSWYGLFNSRLFACSRVQPNYYPSIRLVDIR